MEYCKVCRMFTTVTGNWWLVAISLVICYCATNDIDWLHF
jgi:hypothetical protein